MRATCLCMCVSVFVSVVKTPAAIAYMLETTIPAVKSYMRRTIPHTSPPSPLPRCPILLSVLVTTSALAHWHPTVPPVTKQRDHQQSLTACCLLQLPLAPHCMQSRSLPQPWPTGAQAVHLQTDWHARRHPCICCHHHGRIHFSRHHRWGVCKGGGCSG